VVEPLAIALHNSVPVSIFCYVEGLLRTHPIAKPQAGSKNREEYAENEPATGNNTASSPRA